MACGRFWGQRFLQHPCASTWVAPEGPARLILPPPPHPAIKLAPHRYFKVDGFKVVTGDMPPPAGDGGLLPTSGPGAAAAAGGGQGLFPTPTSSAPAVDAYNVLPKL